MISRRALLVATVAALLALTVQAQTDRAADAKRADPKVVAYVLSSPQRTMAYLTDPDSGYAERIAVALHAGESLDFTALAQIEAALGELRTHGDDFLTEPNRTPGSQRVELPPRVPHTLSILGHVFEVPARRPPYPTSYEERRDCPWPMQVFFALEDAWRALLRRGTQEEFLAYAFSLPCRNESEAAWFARVTLQRTAYQRDEVPAELVGAWRNLAFRGETLRVAGMDPLRLATNDAWWFSHVLVLDSVERHDYFDAAATLPLVADRLPLDRGSASPARRPPYTAILALARAAASSSSMSADQWGAVVSGVERAMGEQAESNITPADFNAWLSAHEQELVAGATREADGLAAARARLAAVQRCAK